MESFHTQFKKSAQRIRLSRRERRVLTDHVRFYMEYHPLPGRMPALPERTRIGGRLGRWLRETAAAGWQLGTEHRALAASATVAFLVVVVTPFLNLNTSIAENVRYLFQQETSNGAADVLADTAYERVEWERAQIEAQLAQVREQASVGDLSSAEEASAVAAVRAHGEAAKRELDILRAQDEAQAAIAEISLASSLDVESHIIGKASPALATALAEVQKNALATSTVQQVSVPTLFASLEAESTAAEELFLSLTPTLEAEEAVALRNRLDEIAQRVAAARENVTAATSDATAADKATLVSALFDIRKLVRYMSDIDVRNRISLEELVPSSLSLAERAELIASRNAQVLQEWRRASSTLAARTQGTSTERIAASLTEAARAHEAATAALENEEIERADRESLRAFTLVKNALAKLQTRATPPRDTSAARPQPATTTQATTSTTSTISTTTVAQPERATGTATQTAPRAQ